MFACVTQLTKWLEQDLTTAILIFLDSLVARHQRSEHLPIEIALESMFFAAIESP